MKKQARVSKGFALLVAELSYGEQCLLLLVSQQSKQRNVLRFEGTIVIKGEDFDLLASRLSTDRVCDIKTASISLLNRVIDASESNKSLHYIPLLQEVRLNNSTRCLAIQFNSQVVHVLGGIEGLLEDMSSNTKVNKDVNKQ